MDSKDYQFLISSPHRVDNFSDEALINMLYSVHSQTLTSERIQKIFENYLIMSRSVRTNEDRLRMLRIFKSLSAKLNILIEASINDIILSKMQTESTKDSFIEQFKDTDTMSKADIHRLSKLSLVFLNNHKAEYPNSSQGVQIKPFLYWLKVKNLKGYEKFKTSWAKSSI